MSDGKVLYSLDDQGTGLLESKRPDVPVPSRERGGTMGMKGEGD